MILGHRDQIPRGESYRVMDATFVYDGECDFCRRWVGRLRKSTADRITYAPYQEVAQKFPDIPYREFEKAAMLIEPDGSVYSGSAGVFRLLSYRGVFARSLWLIYRKLPGFAFLSEVLYRFAARHRGILSK